MLECSALQVSHWKVDHPSDTEEEVVVGLSSEDEAEGLEPTPWVARCRSGSHAPAPSEESHPTAEADEVVLKKRALKWVKQQVTALLHGEDLPEGAQAREVAEIPYQILAVPREGKDCPAYQHSFKTHHCLMVHMGVHRDEKYPCTKCGKVLANRKMWSRRTKACVQGKKVACSVCGKEYASTQGMKQHMKHGADIPEEGGYYICPYCNKGFSVKKTWVKHKPSCSETLIKRVLIFAGSLAVLQQITHSPG